MSRLAGAEHGLTVDANLNSHGSPRRYAKMTAPSIITFEANLGSTEDSGYTSGICYGWAEAVFQCVVDVVNSGERSGPRP